jgi:hypothetical protein
MTATANRKAHAELAEIAALVNRHLDGYAGTDRPIADGAGFRLGRTARLQLTDSEGGSYTVTATTDDRAQLERWTASFANAPAAVIAATIIAAHGKHA